MSAKTLIVVVLYDASSERTRRDARTLRCLEYLFKQSGDLGDRYSVLIWDNSPEPSREELLSSSHEYVHSSRNDGVAGAYNGAAALCERYGYRWMMLLDQDTEVSLAYLDGMQRHRDEVDRNVKVAAIAPLLYEGNFQLSPHSVRKHRAIPVTKKVPGVLEAEAFAANSGLLIRVAALQEIGGYSLDFWLDYSDMYVFHQFYSRGMKLYLAQDLRLEHSMTMLDYDARMSPERYGNFLHAEQAFADLYKTRTQNAIQVLRLAARVVRQRKYRNKIYSRLTLAFLLWRLRTPRGRRQKSWLQRKDQRHTVAS